MPCRSDQTGLHLRLPTLASAMWCGALYQCNIRTRKRDFPKLGPVTVVITGLGKNEDKSDVKLKLIIHVWLLIRLKFFPQHDFSTVIHFHQFQIQVSGIILPAFKSLKCHISTSKVIYLYTFSDHLTVMECIQTKT